MAATLRCTAGQAGVMGRTGGELPVFEGSSLRYAEIAASGTSAQLNLTAEVGEVWLLRVSGDETVRIKVGTNPTAVASDTKLQSGDEFLPLRMKAGEKVAVILG